MRTEDFETLVQEGFLNIPEKFRSKAKNVEFIVEEEPSVRVRKFENLSDDETLLGYYSGIPLSERGSSYGVGPTLPDTIVIYQRPIEEAAGGNPEKIRGIVFDTVWHEFGHYLGLNEKEIRAREKERGSERKNG